MKNNVTDRMSQTFENEVDKEKIKAKLLLKRNQNI